MTIEKCISICRKEELPYSGLEQTVCYCGVEPINGFKWAWPKRCKNQCSGDSSQICGGRKALNIYTTPPKGLNGFCVLDYPGDKRVLNEKKRRKLQNLTIERCKDICKGTGCYLISNNL